MKRRLIEHYEVIRKLGAGGSGVVYLANDTLLMRPVVLKILKRGALSIEQMRSTVLREARLSFSISHGVSHGRSDFAAALELLADTPGLERLITDRFPLERSASAFAGPAFIGRQRRGARASMPRPRGRAYLEASLEAALFESSMCFLASPNLA